MKKMPLHCKIDITVIFTAAAAAADRLHVKEQNRMFGKNKVSQEELDRLRKIVETDEQFFETVGNQKDMFEATILDMEDSYQQMGAGIRQVSENILTATEMAADNVEIEISLSSQLAELKDEIEQNNGQQKDVLDELHDVLDEASDLVDGNKHFTSPSKHLSEISAGFKTQNSQTRKNLNQMEEYGKQMGVLALNAAIEAGRLGESGRQFVTAAEDIRTYAVNYDKLIAEARQQLTEADARIAQLEEHVHHLVSLLKDNNMSTTRLMKSCKEAVKDADRMIHGIQVEVLTEMQNQITALRNSDEEITKSEERNRMQMEDLTEEVLTQQKNQKEIVQMMDPFHRHLAERE